MMQTNIASWMDLAEAEAADQAKTLGLPAFRGRQIWSWLHLKHVTSYDQMTDLPQALRTELEQSAPLKMPVAAGIQRSKIDGTVKYLFEMPDGCLIESVLMRYQHGYTVCVSSQVGCKMGCKFCASTLDGWERDLLPGEMLGQVYAIEREEQVQVSNIVVMGCGEPFDNYDNVLKFLQILHEPKGQNMSYRNMTVSTCGLLEPLRRWTKEAPPVTLAISLHAPNDKVRRQMMPIANRVSMQELLDACRAYTRETNRRVTFEYALAEGVNDSPQQAEELADRLHDLLCHVNLIPVNPVTERTLRGPAQKRVQAFRKVLEEKHIPVTVRRELGADIDGACGQLRRHYRQETEVNP